MVWIRLNNQSKFTAQPKRLQVGTLGITKFASSALGDIIHVEMPAVGTTYKKGETAVSES